MRPIQRRAGSLAVNLAVPREDRQGGLLCRKLSAMKNSSRAAAGAAAGTAILIGLGAAALAGISLALRQKARSAKAAADLLAIHRAHQARQVRQAMLAQRLEHDLRSPIGAMAVALELLRTTDDSATQREAMQVLERQVARMTSLTERVHEFAQGLND